MQQTFASTALKGRSDALVGGFKKDLPPRRDREDNVRRAL
jgi:hypothetical protein